jgi:c-di-GMP-binding flagellar brake protein YcgR
MKLEKVLNVNQKVEIEMPYLSKTNASQEKYPSRVEDLNEEVITLASPIKNRTPVFIPVGEKINVSFVDASGSYMFSTRVIQYKRDLVNQIIVARPNELVRIQQRDYVRLNVNVDISITLTKDKTFYEFEGMTNDLSGGGCRVIIPNQSMGFDYHQELAFSMELNKKTIIGKGLIVWNQISREPGRPDNVLIGIQFNKISEDSIKHIMQFVYFQQIEFRRKGLI